MTSVLDGKLIDFAGHAKRLERSLSELEMASPATEEELLEIHRQLVARNELVDGLIYLQGIEGARAFSFVIDESTGSLTASIARDGISVNVFGACTDADL